MYCRRAHHAKSRMSADTFNSDEIALVARCREESIALLRANSTPEGLLAASLSEDAERRRYCNLFARDAAICALGMVVAGDDALRDTARASLLTLARHQADNGQIPNFVDVLKQEPDFWYVGCIDATLWWLVAVRFCSTHLRDDGLRTTLHPHIVRALHWLRCQEHPRLCLLQQNEASDWADIMPRSGFVLYTNALWYYVKCLYDLPHRDDTRINFNHLFYPYSNAVPSERRLRILMQYARAGGAWAARCGSSRPGAARRGEPRRELGLSRMVSRRDRRGPRHARPVVERRYVPARRVGFESHRVLSALAPSSPFASAKTLLLSIDGRNGIDHHPGKTERVARSQPADAARHLSLQGRASLPAVRKIRRAPAATPR